MVTSIVRMVMITLVIYLSGLFGEFMETQFNMDPSTVMIVFVGSFISLLFLSVYEGEKSVCLNGK